MGPATCALPAKRKGVGASKAGKDRFQEHKRPDSDLGWRSSSRESGDETVSPRLNTIHIDPEELEFSMSLRRHLQKSGVSPRVCGIQVKG